MQISSAITLELTEDESLDLHSLLESFFDYQKEFKLGEQSTRIDLANSLLTNLPHYPKKNLLGQFLEKELSAKTFTMGDIVRIWRERANLTQEQLADNTGTTQTTINAIETGTYKLSETEALFIAIQNELGMPMDTVTRYK